MAFFTTNDGCKLHYEDVGSGKNLLLIHGWSQSSGLFKKNIPELSRHFRVISLDLRGHGESEKITHGYRIARFSKDVHDLILNLELKDVTLLGWSMGCSILWSYWDLFGSDRLSKLVLVDEPGLLLKTSDNEVGMSTYDEVLAMNKDILKDQAAFIKGFINSSLTVALPKTDVDFIVAENLKTPAQYAARLELHHWLTDWRDIIPTITIPTLILSGKKSFINWKSQAWIHEKIAHSKIEYFEERGHFMFFEEPETFNRLVKNFIG
ncbi:MAG: alpha/beta hydrolase [Holophaga sp.]|nr:alpha/beta hydrolase [Holophaga sp.]